MNQPVPAIGLSKQIEIPNYYLSNPLTLNMVNRFLDEMEKQMHKDWLAKQPKYRVLNFKEKRTLNQSVNTTCLL